MLKETLNILNSNRAFSVDNFSKKLNITSDMVTDILSQLERMGYIDKSKTSSCETTKCGSCPYASSCNKEIVKYYQVTEKGINYLNKN